MEKAHGRESIQLEALRFVKCACGFRITHANFHFSSLQHHQFSPELQQDFAHLRQLVSEADFAVKSKFPPQLRAPLAATAIKAVELEEYGEAFFKHLPEIFPYNKFTMTVRVFHVTRQLSQRVRLLIDHVVFHRNWLSAWYMSGIQRFSTRGWMLCLKICVR